MKTREEVKVAERDWSISLKKLLPEGVAIADLEGYVSNEFGEPVFKLTRLVLSNGESVFVEGEHDLPYLCDIKCLPEGQLEALDEANE